MNGHINYSSNMYCVRRKSDTKARKKSQWLYRMPNWPNRIKHFMLLSNWTSNKYCLCDWWNVVCKTWGGTAFSHEIFNTVPHWSRQTWNIWSTRYSWNQSKLINRIQRALLHLVHVPFNKCSKSFWIQPL